MLSAAPSFIAINSFKLSSFRLSRNNVSDSYIDLFNESRTISSLSSNFTFVSSMIAASLSFVDGGGVINIIAVYESMWSASLQLSASSAISQFEWDCSNSFYFLALIQSYPTPLFSQIFSRHFYASTQEYLSLVSEYKS